MVTRKGGFSLPELIITILLLSFLSLVLTSSLQMVIRGFYHADARDDALRQLRQAKVSLTRDLANSSQQKGQFATAPVPGHLTGHDGDALTFLSSDNGERSLNWGVNVTGQAQPKAQITYYLVIPPAAGASAGPADADGYEQQCPNKWLVRRVDSSIATPASPADFGLNPAWTTWLTQPPTLTPQVVADQLLSFRVLGTPPLWRLEISAVAIRDAERKLAVGTVPLRGSPFTLVQRLAIRANN